MNSILFLEISQDFFGVREYVGFGRSSMHKIFLKRCWNFFKIPTSMCKYARESLFSKVVLVYFSYIIPVPKLEIDSMKGLKEFFKSGDAQVLKTVNLVKFRKGFGDISIIVP